MIDLIHADCMEVLRNTPDLAYDIVIADPPYGINASKTMIKSSSNPKKRNDKGFIGKKYHAAKDWDSAAPGAEWFEQIRRVSKHQIIFGANYFPQHLPPSKGWVYWRKNGMNKNPLFSDGELVYTSFATNRLREFDYPWIGLGYINNPQKEKKIHPTQKPVALYLWLLQEYTDYDWKILDTHLGSGSSAIAADMLNMDFVGIEKDADFYAAALARLKEHQSQLTLGFV